MERERQIRGRNIGRPGLCTSTCWNDLFEIMYYTPGDGVVTVMQEKHRRKQAFIQEQDRTIGSNWDWLRLKTRPGKQNRQSLELAKPH